MYSRREAEKVTTSHVYYKYFSILYFYERWNVAGERERERERERGGDWYECHHIGTNIFQSQSGTPRVYIISLDLQNYFLTLVDIYILEPFFFKLLYSGATTHWLAPKTMRLVHSADHFSTNDSLLHCLVII